VLICALSGCSVATSNIENSGPFGSSTIADGPINPSPSISSALAIFSSRVNTSGPSKSNSFLYVLVVLSLSHLIF